MALTLSATAAAAVAVSLDTFGALLDGGALRLYTGTRPATPDVAVTTQTRLAAPTFADPAFEAAVGDVITAAALIADPDAAATGEATWFRAVTSAEDPVCDGDVGTSGADCLLSSTRIVVHSPVTISGGALMTVAP